MDHPNTIIDFNEYLLPSTLLENFYHCGPLYWSTVTHFTHFFKSSFIICMH